MRCILVVDDDDSIRRLISQLLTRHGWRVIEANQGHAGLALARQHLPDLIISDVEMPSLNGHAMLRALQTDPVTAAIPVIFLTGREARDDVRLGMNLGADDYITKPFRLDEVLTAVESRLARHERLAERFAKKLDHLQQHLTTTLPHELRTPLVGILGYSEIILEQPDRIGPDELRWAAQAIRSSGERLQRCVESFLLYAELASTTPQALGRAYAAVEACEAARCLEQVARARTQLHGREPDLVLTIAPVWLALPELYLQRLFEEVVDNACRYSSPGTPVTVVLEVGTTSATVRITDAGRGMDADQVQELGAFVQFDRQRYEQQGLGLGLAISRRIVERFGGSMRVDSVMAQGTTVTANLPIAAAQGRPPFANAA